MNVIKSLQITNKKCVFSFWQYAKALCYLSIDSFAYNHCHSADFVAVLRKIAKEKVKTQSKYETSVFDDSNIVSYIKNVSVFIDNKRKD